MFADVSCFSFIFVLILLCGHGHVHQTKLAEGSYKTPLTSQVSHSNVVPYKFTGLPDIIKMERRLTKLFRK